MIEVYANDINPYNNRTRRTEHYMVDCSSEEEALRLVKELKAEPNSTWVFDASPTEKVVLTDAWEE